MRVYFKLPRFFFFTVLSLIITNIQYAEKRILILHEKASRLQGIIAEGVISRYVHAEMTDILESNQLSSCDNGEIAVVVSIGSSATEKAMAMCRRTPIVFAMVTAPKMRNFEKAKNLTGVSFDVSFRMFMSELKKVLKPGSKLGFVYSTDINEFLTGEMNYIEGEFGFRGLRSRVSQRDQLGKELQRIIEVEKVSAIWVLPDPLYNQAIFRKLSELCAEKKILLITNFESLVTEAGAAFALAPDYFEMGVQASEIVSDILKGREPQNIPYQMPEKTGVYLNQKFFADIQLQIPNELKFREKVTSLINEGQILLKDGKTSQAVAKFREALRFDKRNEVANYFINSIQAKDSYQTALNRLESGNRRGALPYLMYAAPYLPEARSKLYGLRAEMRGELTTILEKGIQDFKSKKYNNCIVSMNLVLMIEPGHKEAAIYKEKAGKRAKAISAIK